MRTAGAVAAPGALATLPALAGPAWGHAIVQRYALPVPLWYYLAGAGLVGGPGLRAAHREHGVQAAVAPQLPMLVLMVGYTIFSLWIIGQPIVEV